MEIFITTIIKVLTRFRIITRFVFFPVLKIPFFRKRMSIVTQAVLGATAFEIHDVDRKEGRIGIGDVDETMWSSKIFPVLKQRLALELGHQKTKKFIYELSEEMGYLEADTALSSGRWVPQYYKKKFDNKEILLDILNDNKFRMLFEESMKLAIRLIFNGGGWGVVKNFDLSHDPVIIKMKHLQEARHGKPSKEPICTYITGYLAGFMSRLMHKKAHVVETHCEACNDEECVFEISYENEV